MRRYLDTAATVLPGLPLENASESANRADAVQYERR